MGNLKTLLKRCFEYFIVCKMDTGAYLRRQGTRIGEHCEILTKISSFGSEPWLIEIGDRVTVCADVILITHDASTRVFRNQFSNTNKMFGNKFGAIKICDDCFIGVNSVILPGVTIGSRSIIGAGSVVTRDVPPETVVAGNPAQVLFSLQEYIERYQKKMFPVDANDRISLRKELTKKFWGEER